jgi:hypothetical protein
VTQLPDAEAIVLTTPPKLVKAKHGGESTLAEENPLPPSPTCVKQPSPVESTGPASAVAEKLLARAKGALSARQITHNADKPRKANSLATSFSLQIC